MNFQILKKGKKETSETGQETPWSMPRPATRAQRTISSRFYCQTFHVACSREERASLHWFLSWRNPRFAARGNTRLFAERVDLKVWHVKSHGTAISISGRVPLIILLSAAVSVEMSDNYHGSILYSTLKHRRNPGERFSSGYMVVRDCARFTVLEAASSTRGSRFKRGFYYSVHELVPELERRTYLLHSAAYAADISGVSFYFTPFYSNIVPSCWFQRFLVYRSRRSFSLSLSFFLFSSNTITYTRRELKPCLR